MSVALCMVSAGWAYGDDFTETLDNAGKSYDTGNVAETRLYVQDLLKILDDQEALLMTQCVNENFSALWAAGEAEIQTGDSVGLGKGSVSFEQRFTTEEGKSRGSRVGSSGGGKAKTQILQTQGWATLTIKKGRGNFENMLGGLGKLLGAQNSRKGRFIKLGENRGNIKFQEKNFNGKVTVKVGEEMDVEVKGHNIDKKQLLDVANNAVDWSCLNKLPK